MQSDGKPASFTAQIQLLLATREEDFQELSRKIADVQRQQNTKVDTMTERILRLEKRVAGL
jgi:hypothetical protein